MKNAMFPFIVAAFVGVATALPAPMGIKFEERSTLPTLTLPYGTYQAYSYDVLTDIEVDWTNNANSYKFKNIRYAAPPVGDLRWAKPQPPAYNASLQDGSYGNECVQAPVMGVNLAGSGNESAIGAALNQFGGAEDCLFLDVYVPGIAIRNTSLKLPVITWIYGGAYIFGSKDALEPELPLYDGTGLIISADNQTIFVAMNYRLGAYGFLAGSTMEEDGLPNAGLWDQRAAFEWVQSYISLLGGDPTQVTAMGESAGAGSIEHHLIAEGGTLDPLFTKAYLQSPAFALMYDRHGTLEQTFQNFSTLAGCAGGSLACLRAASAADLENANTQLNTNSPDGSFAVGPAADGSYIRQLASLELASGNFWPMSSLVTSHVADEAALFVDGHIETDEQFNVFVNQTFPGYASAAGIPAVIEAFYPPVATNNTYATETDRVKAFVRDSSFTCNTRYLTTAFGDASVWNMQYSVTPGYHATDLLPTFYNAGVDWDAVEADLPAALAALFGGLAVAYQSYVTSYARTGDPNTYRKAANLPSAIEWPHPASGGEQVTGVLNVGDGGYSIISDTQSGRTACDFWVQVAAAVTDLGGYAPPGAVVSQTLVPATNDPSARY